MLDKISLAWGHGKKLAAQLIDLEPATVEITLFKLLRMETITEREVAVELLTQGNRNAQSNVVSFRFLYFFLTVFYRILGKKV